MDIDLDVPHTVPNDSDDVEGGDPFDELHDLGDGDEDAFANQNTSIVVILGDLTAILQSLDCDFVFVHRHHYQKMADEWACKNSNTKLIAAQRQMLGTHFTAAAYKYAIFVVNIAESFKRCGYIWPTADVATFSCGSSQTINMMSPLLSFGSGLSLRQTMLLTSLLFAQL